VSVFNESTVAPSPGRGPLIVAGAVALVLAIAAWLFYANLEDPAAPAEPAVSEALRIPAPEAEPGPAPEPEPSRPLEPRLTTRPAPTRAAPARAPDAALATLVVESDVPGASVFLDREYLGETPLRVANLAPGARQLNLSATGHESISREVTLEPGDQTVAMRFREVRLDLSMPVVHRHGVGSCEGQLIGTLDGLRYETPHRNDAFTLAYDQIETFEIDYLEKNLRVKQRGGRTWNFTERNAANADALFVFHRDVMAARDKLASGYAPVP
jgi:hypothetical protein